MSCVQISDVVITIMMGLMTIILFYLNISCLISMVQSIKQKRIHISKVVIGSMITLIFYFMCGTAFFLYGMMSFWNGIIPLLRVIATACYLFAQISMIFTFISRIEKAFDGSYLAISSFTKKALYISWIGLIMIGLFVLVIGLSHAMILSISGTIWLLLYTTLSVVLIVLFIRKLTFLMKKTSPSSNYNVATLVDMDFVDTAIKNGLLVSISIASSFVFDILALTTKLTISFHSVTNIDYYLVWIVIDAMVTSLGIYLLFAFNQNKYSILCSKMHQKCKTYHDGSSVSRIPIGSISAIEGPSHNETDGTMASSELNLVSSGSNPTSPPSYRQHVNLHHLILQSQAFALSDPVNKTYHDVNVKPTNRSEVTLINIQTEPTPTSLKPSDLSIECQAYSSSL